MKRSAKVTPQEFSAFIQRLFQEGTTGRRQNRWKANRSVKAQCPSVGDGIGSRTNRSVDGGEWMRGSGAEDRQLARPLPWNATLVRKGDLPARGPPRRHRRLATVCLQSGNKNPHG